MSSDYGLTAVVFADNIRKLYRTFTSFCGLPNQHTQFLVVPVQKDFGAFPTAEVNGKEEYNAWLEIKRYKGTVLINTKEKSSVLNEIRENSNGKYITFLKAGTVLYKTPVDKILQAAAVQNSDVVITGLRGTSSRGSIIHNQFFRSFKDESTLDTNGQLVHQFYPAYYFRAEKFKWADSLCPDIWCLDILRLVYLNISECENFRIAKNCWTNIGSGADITDGCSAMLKAAETLETFYSCFFTKMLDCFLDKTNIHRVTGSYTMIFYCVQLADALYRTENLNPQLVEMCKNSIGTFFKAMKDAKPVLLNPYISREKKKVIIERYFPYIVPGYSTESDLVLRPEYSWLNLLIFKPTATGIHFEVSLWQTADTRQVPWLVTEGKCIACTYKHTLRNEGWVDEIACEEKVYEADIPYEAIGSHLCFGIKYGDQIAEMRNVRYGKFVPFTERADLYINVGGKLMFLDKADADSSRAEKPNRYRIAVKDRTKAAERQLRKERTLSLLKYGKMGIKAIAARGLTELIEKRRKKCVWLVSDRIDSGDDNGEVMFRYLSENPPPNTDVYFLINRNTETHKRIQKLGKTVVPYSKKHKLLFLLNEFSISSQANIPVRNPFRKSDFLYRDLIYDKRLVFLQHGVTKDDQSKWLNKYNCNLFGLIASTKPEYDSLLMYDYFYTDKEIWMTGMPRYDRLKHNEKRYITIMPTWRKYLSSGTDSMGRWKMGDAFRDSAFFDFYQKLLTDRKLLAAAEKYQYKICFMPHPNMLGSIDLFEKDERVLFMSSSCSYSDIFAQTNLMVTDYSSVAFDFAYLRKPVIYAQFDKTKFFSGEHSYTGGYFDYENDGFGDVAYSLEDTVDMIIEYMKNDCKLKDEYRKRIDATFAFSDRRCSERVYLMLMNRRQAF